jgi:hypothetical protein
MDGLGCDPELDGQRRLQRPVLAAADRLCQLTGFIGGISTFDIENQHLPGGPARGYADLDGGRGVHGGNA